MPRVRLQPDQRRAELVAAARKLFTERGVDETSVSDIVKAAGVAQGTFYWHFKAKDDVLNAVVSEIVEENCSAAIELAKAPGLTAPEKIIRLAKAMYASVLSAGAPLAHFHRPEHKRLHDEMMGATIVRLTPVIAGVVRQGVDEGAFTTAHPDEAAAFALACAIPVGNEWPLREGESGERIVTALLDFVLKGLGWRGEARRLGSSGNSGKVSV